MVQDFREILKAQLSDRCQRNGHYSLRAFARDLGLSPQRLSHILSGRHGLSVEAAGQIAEKLGLSEKEKEFFCILVQEKHARSKLVRHSAKNKLKEIKTTYQDLSLDHFKIIADWYHFAIMELTLVENFKSQPKWIAKTLNVTEMEVKLAIERLIKLEMLEKDKKGNLKLTGQFFTDPRGIPSEAVRHFHRQLLVKANLSLDVQSLTQRDFSSTILAIDDSDLPQAKEDLKKFRNEFDSKYSKATKKNKVYCLGMQFHDLTAGINEGIT